MDPSDSRFIKRTFENLIWNGKILFPATKFHKISIVQTCMDRCHNLEETLPFNMALCKDYPGIEFVIINYNSKDLLDDYVKKNHMKDIESGLLNYYKTIEPGLPLYYSMSHSRNIGFKVAQGEIVASVDADVFLKDKQNPPEEKFPFYLNHLAAQHPDNSCFFGKGVSNLHGFLCFYKENFINVLGGYAEEYGSYYGCEDRGLMTQAFFAGYKFFWFGGGFCSRINTSRFDKLRNHIIKDIKKSEEHNKKIYFKHFENKIINPNEGKHWGKAILLKNFREEVFI